MESMSRNWRRLGDLNKSFMSHRDLVGSGRSHLAAYSAGVEFINGHENRVVVFASQLGRYSELVTVIIADLS